MNSKPRPRGPRAQKVAPPAILDAAQEVFSVHGLEGSSIRAIANRAGCDPALIYYHYASKEALFLALLERRIPPVAARLAEIARPTDLRSARARIWDALEAFHQHLGEDAGFRAVFRGQLIQGSEAIKDAVAAQIQPILASLREVLRQGVERGELRQDLELMTTTFFIGRMHMEILDLVPSMGPRIAGASPLGGLHEVRRAWLDFLWRSISRNPTQERNSP